MEKYENIKEASIEVNLTAIIDFLSEFKKTKKGKILSKYETINNLDIEFFNTEDCIEYKTSSLKKIDQKIEYIGFGMLDPFEILIGDRKFQLLKGANSARFKLSEFKMNGKIKEIESNLSDSKGYYKAILSIDGFTKIPSNYFWTKSFKIKQNIRAAGYLEINIGNYSLGLFDYMIDNQNYLILECHCESSRNEFEKLLESILYSFALISGCLVKDVQYILKFRNPDFSKVEGFSFKKSNENVITNKELYNYREYKAYSGADGLFFFPKKIFSNLAQCCRNDDILLRAVRIICQSRNLSVEIEAAAIFVALETVKGIVIKENSEKIVPFKDPKFADQILKEFKIKIDSLDDSNFNSKKSVINKLDSLNQVGNNESFKLAFELVGFELSKSDLKCISMRNRFLHGNMPYDDKNEDIRMKELTKISLSAHFLTCCLILKYVGFNGVVKNFLKYLDLTNCMDEVDEELFRYI
jgi:hypothetical protein